MNPLETQGNDDEKEKTDAVTVIGNQRDKFANLLRSSATVAQSNTASVTRNSLSFLKKSLLTSSKANPILPEHTTATSDSFESSTNDYNENKNTLNFSSDSS
jgi:hypothetical protein